MKAVYNLVFKRTSTFAVATIASVFFFERTLDLVSTNIYRSVNKGVSCVKKSDYLIRIFANLLIF